MSYYEKAIVTNIKGVYCGKGERMKPILFFPHLGLGDHVISCGIVKNIDKGKKIMIVCKKHNAPSVKRMHPEHEFLIVEDHGDAVRKVAKIRAMQTHDIVAVNTNISELKNGESFDQNFYSQLNLPYEDRWNKFSYERDEEKEKIILGTIPAGEFAFVHDDKSRNLGALEGKLPKDLQIYRPNHWWGKDTDITIFDYVPLIERAKEIHCMDSSFATMIDHIASLKDKSKFIHRYIRECTGGGPFYKNGWKIL